MIEIGKEVYYYEPKSKEINKGVIIGVNITVTGYLLYSILPEKGKTINLEEAHIKLTKDAIEQHKIDKLPIIEEANKKIDDTTKEVDILRKQVIGKPTYEEIAKRITEGNNG
jgi:hypothetical protein